MRIERSIDMEPDNFEELETKGKFSKKVIYRYLEIGLRILAMYEAKTAQISNFWTF